MVASFRHPFDLLAETTAIAASSAAGESANPAKCEIWLGRRDSSRTIASCQVVAVDGDASAAASDISAADISAAAEEVSAELVLRITSLNHLPSGWREILAPSFAASRASGVTLLMLHGEFGLFIVDQVVRQPIPI